MADEQILIELALEGSQESIAQVADLENRLKDLNKRIKEEGKITAKTKKEQIDLRNQKKKLNKEIQDNIKNFGLSSKNVHELGNTYNDLVTKNRILKKEYKDLDPAIEGNAERMQELAEEINNNSNTLKEYDAALGDNFRNVGNYKGAITEALQESGLFGKELGMINKVQETFTKVTQGAGKAVSNIKDDFAAFKGNILKGNKATGKSIKSLKGLRLALIQTGIGAIVVALGLLLALMSKWQPVIDLATKAMTILGTVINELVERAGKLGTAIVKLFKGDFKGAAEEATKAVDNFGSAIIDAAKNGAKIADLEGKLRALRREVDKNVQSLESQKAIAQLIADDNTRNFELRRKQAEKVRKLDKEIAEEKLRLANKEYALALLQSKNNKKDEAARTKSHEAILKRRQAQLDLRLVTQENAKLQREINRDQLEAQLDILIDGFDNQKTINEKLIEDDKKTFDERRNILAATAQLGTKSFEEQIAIIQKLTKEQVNANDLLAEQDAVALVKKIEALKLDEISQTRLLEIIRERRTAVSDFAELEKDLNEQELESTKQTELKKLELEKRANKDNLDDLIATIKKERDIKLQAVQDDEVAKALIIAESEDKITAIKKAAADQQTTDANEAQNKRTEIVSQAEKNIGEIMAIASNLFQAQMNNELNAAGDNAEKREAIEKKFAKRQQKVSILQAIINGALAASKTLAQLGGVGAITPAGIAALGLIAASTASQVAVIASQKFAKGGLVHGKSHAQGGEKFAVGGRVAELEGGEAVINRNSTAMFKPILSAINEAGGGKKFAFGGITPDAQLSSLNTANMADDIGSVVANQLNTLRVVNVVSDTTSKQISISNVESEAIF